MSSIDSEPTSKRGRIRKWLRDNFGRSSSQSSPSPPAPASLAPPNQRNSTAAIPDAQTVPPTDPQLLAAQTAPNPPATSAELPNLEPGQQMDDCFATIGQVDVAKEAEVLGSLVAPPQIPPPLLSSATLPSTNPTSEPAGATGATKAANGIWAGLRTSLKMLAETDGVFGPVASAARVLLDVCDTFETAAQNQQDYEDLVAELTTLSQSVAQHFKANKSNAMSDCVSGIVKRTEDEAAEMKRQAERGTGRQLLTAKLDEVEMMRGYRRIQPLFRQLQINLSASTRSIANQVLVNTRLDMLRSVDPADYDSSLATSISRRTCTEGTRTKVLQDLAKWANNANGAEVYWMNGMADTGKTTTAYTFSDLLMGRSLLAASLFYSAVVELVPAPPVELLLAGPLQNMGDATLRSQVVVIDALDECDDQVGVEMLLDALFKLTSRLPLKFFVTSRPEPRIFSKMMDHAGSRTAVHLHDIEKSLVSADIELYLQEVLAPVLPNASQIKELVERSGVLFIYAATLARYILPGDGKVDPQKRLRLALKMTPETVKGRGQIEALYTAVLKSALEDEGMDEEREDARTVLGMVLLAQEPIQVEVIAMLGGIGDASRPEPFDEQTFSFKFTTPDVLACSTITPAKISEIVTGFMGDYVEFAAHMDGVFSIGGCASVDIWFIRDLSINPSHSPNDPLFFLHANVDRI
ncbi:hypothetical protein BN14_08394 [Rhizoctonia solani AG-1 IB]|uniref:Nephrocystin 3-like N-terminal domain-containing protein n=1 Tax=Thanatephorus cucumeris (strain AG1-IB / isolate 7/3/14) TaxID=1108050 RepID=M5C4P8_THACB|nr:hypothetical protein BN14_08394 [Rhizoctonia solani AG-1 IB]